MKISITLTITDELIDKVKRYTHSSTITEAVNFAIKDCLVIYKMRELNEKLLKKSMRIDKIQQIQE
jgi:hypothetical protein